MLGVLQFGTPPFSHNQYFSLIDYVDPRYRERTVILSHKHTRITSGVFAEVRAGTLVEQRVILSVLLNNPFPPLFCLHELTLRYVCQHGLDAGGTAAFYSRAGLSRAEVSLRVCGEGKANQQGKRWRCFHVLVRGSLTPC